MPLRQTVMVWTGEEAWEQTTWGVRMMVWSSPGESLSQGRRKAWCARENSSGWPTSVDLVFRGCWEKFCWRNKQDPVMKALYKPSQRIWICPRTLGRAVALVSDTTEHLPLGPSFHWCLEATDLPALRYSFLRYKKGFSIPGKAKEDKGKIKFWAGNWHELYNLRKSLWQCNSKYESI